MSRDLLPRELLDQLANCFAEAGVTLRVGAHLVDLGLGDAPPDDASGLVLALAFFYFTDPDRGMKLHKIELDENE